MLKAILYMFYCLELLLNLYKSSLFQRVNMYRPPEDAAVIRVRIPKDKEVLGIVKQRLGGSRMRISCLDGKERICRIPGRLRRSLWVRENDVVVVEPWELGGDNTSFGIA